VARLGHGRHKDYRTVARILDRHCDLAAIVEVMQKGGERPGLAALAQTLGASWATIATDAPRPNAGSAHAEHYAVLWRPSRLRLCPGWSGLRYVVDHDGSSSGQGRDRFVREPAYGCFDAIAPRGLGFDLLLAVFHATWQGGKVSAIAAEAQQLDHAAAEMRRSRPGENDLLVVGDFNLRPARLARETRLRPWTLATGSTLDRWGRRTRNLYDQLLLHDAASTPEIPYPARILDVRSESASPLHFVRTVSDHLPLVVVIEVFRADDD
jgi:hypothetical protein